jgi:hypothetical protein
VDILARIVLDCLLRGGVFPSRCCSRCRPTKPHFKPLGLRAPMLPRSALPSWTLVKRGCNSCQCIRDSRFIRP